MRTAISRLINGRARQMAKLVLGRIVRHAYRHPYALVVAGEGEDRLPRDFKERLDFYLPGWRCYGTGAARNACRPPSSLRLRDAGTKRVPILSLTTCSAAPGHEVFQRPLWQPHYWVNPEYNPSEAWEWIRLVFRHVGPRPDLSASCARFAEYVERMGLRKYGRAYVFGTGPSLGKAGERDWSDGARIVCNTIVRDRSLWHHIQPHIVLAADAGYHFGFTRHARAFRADLRQRLAETDTLFVYPELNHPIVVREMPEMASRLIPIPERPHKDLAIDLLKRFELPGLHNVLPRLLAVASTLADEIFLWGFDGRGPADASFWANAAKQSYPELMDDLRAAYPAFFKDSVPDHDPLKYTRTAFGDELDESLTAAEQRGKRFVMMHKSYTEILQKRYRGAS